jgi:SAM-dependent methyltransferase
MNAAVYSPNPSIFAPPRLVTRLDDCNIYHTIDVPGYGTIVGPWDLRGHVDSYLGGVDLRGKRVLELGTASGFLCIEMEKRGAEVVAYDLSEDYDGDLVPFPQYRDQPPESARRATVRRINNGWWLVHRAFKSSARMVYGSVYDVPAEIGMVDVATFGSILLHLRDPYRALASAARLVRETIIVTDQAVHWENRFPAPDPPTSPQPGGQRGRLLRIAHRLLGDPGWWKREEQLREREATLRAVLNAPLVMFLPNTRDPEQDQAWWCFQPAAIIAMLETLGFTRTTLTYSHGATDHGQPMRLYTIVANRG